MNEAVRHFYFNPFVERDEMKKFIFIVSLFSFLVLHTSLEISSGEDFCVDDAVALQNALNSAALNNEADTIQIVKGTYHGGAGAFHFVSHMEHGITVRGGYDLVNSTCQFPASPPNPADTILDGDGLNRVMYIQQNLGGNIMVERLTFRNGNTDQDGGGLWASAFNSAGKAGDVTVSYNIIEYNQADRFGGVWADSYGGTGNSGDVTVTKNIIRNNTATNDYGGGLARSETGSYMSGSVTMSDNIVTNNTSENGMVGGFMLHSRGDSGSGSATMSANIISGNNSEEYAGGAYIYSKTVTGPFGGIHITNNIITNNHSNDFAGGLYVFADLFGSADTGVINFSNNTISENNATVSGGGLYCYRLGGSLTIINLYNNIVWNNSAPVGADMDLQPGAGGGDQVLNGFNNDYNIISGSWDNEADNINQDPDFIGGEDYHLKTSSPCIDAGTATAPALPASDIDGDGRIIGRAPDMGADELVPFFHWPMFLPAIQHQNQQ